MDDTSEHKKHRKGKAGGKANKRKERATQNGARERNPKVYQRDDFSHIGICCCISPKCCKNATTTGGFGPE
jgi:hypothetical protein